MKKPNIEIEEFGAMGPDGFEIKIDGEAIATTNRLAFADAYESMIDVLIDCHEALDYLPDDALGKVRPADSFEEYPVKYELIHNIRKALKKAGCTG